MALSKSFFSRASWPRSKSPAKVSDGRSRKGTRTRRMVSMVALLVLSGPPRRLGLLTDLPEIITPGRCKEEGGRVLDRLAREMYGVAYLRYADGLQSVSGNAGG